MLQRTCFENDVTHLPFLGEEIKVMNHWASVKEEG